ncbi:V-set and transmembrane domain-containing protein 2-like protein [Pholidichthys leucotaenia]
MGAFGLLLGILPYAGLYIQLNDAHGEVDNHISGNALFTEVPHDITSHSGEDVEMACSYRGMGSPSFSLEIQWWYIKERKNWEEKPTHITNNVVPMEEMSKDATKISVVKVAGSNISHKLRLSSIKPSDEGTYECRVIDYSGTVTQHHRVRAYLYVAPERSQGSEDVQDPGRLSEGIHPHSTLQSEDGEVKKRSTGSNTDCNESCVI